jgi:hypothetical protein
MTLVSTAILAAGLAVQAAGQPIPDWYLEHVAYMTADGGRWETGNADYMSDAETYDTYVIVFTSRFGGTGMTGELFDLEDGEASPVFWDFSGYWDPEAGQAMLVQHGWGGAMGAGPVEPGEAGIYVAEQDFHAPGQAPRHERHRFRVIDPDTHETVSTHVTADGSETPGRIYVWRRVAGEME